MKFITVDTYEKLSRQAANIISAQGEPREPRGRFSWLFLAPDFIYLIYR